MTNEQIEVIKNAIFAAMGGIVRELANEGEHNLVRFIAGGFIGVFTGLLTYCVCKHLVVGEYFTAALVGLGGYTGVPLLDVSGRKLKAWVAGRNR